MGKAPGARRVFVLAGAVLLSAVAWLFMTTRRDSRGNVPGFAGQADRPAAAHRADPGLVASETPQAIRESPEPSPQTPGATGDDASALLLEEACKELAVQIDESLDGFLYINDMLDQILAFANLPVEDQADFDYEDNDAVAYRIKGTPPGTIAHFLVGLMPFDRDGKSFRYLQMEIQMDTDAEPRFYRDAMREGPRVHLTLDYDEEGNPGAFALLTERRVALHESRESGINAYQGRYTSGAGYKIDLHDQQKRTAETFGIINGAYAHGDSFGGINPLVGDLEVDPARIDRLLRRLMNHLENVRSKTK